MAPRYVLTLVHGTWGSTKGWVADGSLLRQELTRRLTPASSSQGTASLDSDHVVFHEFAWTGANAHAARTRAGVQLAHSIRDAHARYPEAQHFIVAHSHGGNVALYAMRDPAARRAISGIVTLGAPFIHARPRHVERHADLIAWVLLAVLSLAVVGVLDMIGLPRAAFACLVAGMVLVATMKGPVSRWLTHTASLEQAEIVKAIEPPCMDTSNLAILCTSGDEARGWLRTWDSLAQIPFLIGFVVLSLIGLSARTNLPALVDGLARKTIRRGIEDVRLFGFDGLAVVFVGGIVLCLACGVVLMVSGVLRWPGYFPGSLLTNLLVEVGTERVPRASGDALHAALVFDLPAPKNAPQLRGRLRHTAICRNRAVVSAICEWLGRRTVPRNP